MDNFKHSPTQTSLQLRDQISSEKRKLGFFLGAGSSMAVGVPGIIDLTKKVSEKLSASSKLVFHSIQNNSGSDNIEHVLNKLRTIRELIGNSPSEELYGVKGITEGQKLDVEICKAISEIVSESNSKEIIPHINFSNWLSQNQATRILPIEVFTTNYDLLIEYALEQKGLPYFDGFVGTIEPFLIPECIEAENNKSEQNYYIPYSWIRLWKLHGSINWFLVKDKDGNKKIIRSTNRTMAIGDELMIYPSKQKYDESRRLPFLIFQDRLRKFLSSGETLLIILGYSFGDDHLNEILFQALRANKRLAITALVFGEIRSADKKKYIEQNILDYGYRHPNLTILGPDRACIGGVIAEWDNKEADLDKASFWNTKDACVNLGDFSSFTQYLQLNFV